MNRTGWAVYEIVRRVLLLGVVVGVFGLTVAGGNDTETRMADLSTAEQPAAIPVRDRAPEEIRAT